MISNEKREYQDIFQIVYYSPCIRCRKTYQFSYVKAALIRNIQANIYVIFLINYNADFDIERYNIHQNKPASGLIPLLVIEHNQFGRF